MRNLIFFFLLISFCAFSQKTPATLISENDATTYSAPFRIRNAFNDQILSNVNQRVPVFLDSADITKRIKWFLHGSHPTGTTYNLTLPNGSGTIARTSDLGGFITGNILGEQQVTLIDNFIDPVSFGIKIHFEGEPDGYSMFKAGSDLFGIGLISRSPTNGFAQLFSGIGNGQLSIMGYDTGPYYHFTFSSSPESYAAQFTDFRATKYGITYADDYSSDFTSRSLVDKAYVDSVAGGGGVSDGDKGDITVSGSGATWTIDSTAVTYAKIQNVAANSFLANATGSSATVQEIATSRIPLFGSAITGTPSATTFLRGDGAWSNSLTRNVSNSANIFSLRNSSTGSNAVTTISIGNNSSGETFKIGITGSNYTNTEYDNSPANATNLFTKTASPIRIGTNDTLRYTISETGDHLFNGTLSVTGDVTATGAVTGSNLSGTNTGDQTLSDITAATGANTINSGANHQIWDWNSLTSGTGMSFRSSSTGADSSTLQVVSIEKSGANANSSQTTTALNVSNTSTGTSATNVAGRFTASGGTNNYALDIVGGINWSNGANMSTWTQTHTGSLPGINLVTNRNAAVSQFGIQNINGGASAETRFRLAGGGQMGWLAMAGANNTSAYGEGYRMALWNSANAGIIFGTNNTGRAVFTNDNKFVFGATTITSGSVLADFQSTTSGVLVPRVTNTAAISTPVNGMVAYDSATNEFIFRQNSSWTGLGIGGSVGSTDNAILRADVGSGVVQSSLLSINDSGGLVSSDTTFTVTLSNGSEIGLDGGLKNIVISGTSATLDNTHVGKNVKCTSDSETDLTVSSTIVLEKVMTITQRGNGTVNLLAGPNVVINGKTSTTGQWDMIWLYLIEKSGGISYYIGR